MGDHVMAFDDEDLLEELIVESEEHLTAIEPDLLTLEKDGSNVDAELINRIFRAMHSIKGGFAFFALSHIVDMAHVMESVLMKVRDGELTVSPEMTDALLAGTDKLRELLGDVHTSENVPIDGETAPLKAILEGQPIAAIAPEAEIPAPVAEAEKSEPNEETETVTAVAEPDPEPSIEAPPKPASLELVSPPPASEAKAEAAPAADKKSEKSSSDHGETIRVKVDLLDNLMNLAGELVLGRNQIKLALNSRISETSTAQSGMKRLEDELRRVRESILSVDTEGKMVGVVDREFGKIRSAIDHALSARAIETPGMGAVMQDVDMVTSELQSSIMNTRMQPVGSVFAKFPRIIRDLAKKMSKEIELTLIGQDVELDKSIIEALTDPLTHLVRNCADHAIELPRDREAQGKSRIGNVRIRAYHEGGQVNIDITDDGRGLDAEKLKQKAIEKNILTPDAASKINEREAHRLIFAPGFSMAKQVSDVSGRGVGMDVVRTNIEQLGGTVEIESNIGTGTRINLRLPLTLAIIPSLIIGSRGRRYAVPQVNLEELVRVRGQEDDKRIEHVRGRRLLRLRGTLLPLVDLNEVLGTKDLEARSLLDPKANALTMSEIAGQSNQTEEPTGAESDDVTAEATETEITIDEKDYNENDSINLKMSSSRAYNILVLKVGENRYGLVVDELLDNEEIVVKPLSGYLKECKHYAGSTIMGDGRVAMILDAAGIATTAKLRFGEMEEHAEAAALDSKSATGKEVQPLLLFRAGSNELFAISLALVSRIEKVKRSELELVGDKQYVKYSDSSMRIVQLHDALPIDPPTKENERFFIIVPKMIKNPMGIVASEVVDILHVDAEIDRYNVTGKGIVGSAVLDGNMIVFIDIYGLFEVFDPTLYAIANDQASVIEGMNLLLVEDAAFFQSVEAEYLRGFGCTVDIASDGVEGYEMLCKNHYDLVVTDIEMPRMDGFELTERIRANDSLKHMPIIAVTSLYCDKSKKRGEEVGFDAYEMKLDKNRLYDTIAQVIETRQGDKQWTSSTQPSMSVAAASE
jgi:two-component system, chemotaxis family, sensor kinase CheA